jgi:hypothetical protein
LKEVEMMKGIKELSSEELRELYCAPENTDDPESVDFEDEPEEKDFREENLLKSADHEAL